MRLTRIFITGLLLLPGASFGASKEQLEMQRDIATLQDQVRTLQSGFDRNMSSLQTLVQQALDAATRANTGVSVISAGVTSTLEHELQKSLTPIAGLAAKIENTNNDVAEVRNSVADLNSSMNKVLQILTDMNNTLKVMQAPAAAPPPSSVNPGGPPQGGGAAMNAPPAAVMFANAKNDQTSGKLDLALGEYADFLKYHPDDPNGAAVQYNIGEIHYSQSKLDLAVQDFDAVIERYSENSLTPDAYFMKGMVLKQNGKRDAAATTFKTLTVKFPHSPKAEQAKDQLHAMGYNVAAPAPLRRKSR